MNWNDPIEVRGLQDASARADVKRAETAASSADAKILKRVEAIEDCLIILAAALDHSLVEAIDTRLRGGGSNVGEWAPKHGDRVRLVSMEAIENAAKWLGWKPELSVGSLGTCKGGSDATGFFQVLFDTNYIVVLCNTSMVQPA